MSHHSSTQCELLQLQGYLTPGRLDFESRNSPIHYSPFTISGRSKGFLFFSLSFQFVPNSLKKEKLVKVIFWMLPRPTKKPFWTVLLLIVMQFSEDMSVMDTGKYRKLVLTGGIWGSCPGSPGLGRMHVIGLEIVYLLMYFWTRTTRTWFWTKRYNGTPLAVLGP